MFTTIKKYDLKVLEKITYETPQLSTLQITRVLTVVIRNMTAFGYLFMLQQFKIAKESKNDELVS